MTITTLLFRAFLLSALSLMTIMRAAPLYAASPTGDPLADVKGKWSGTFVSNHSGVAPFTITLVINPNSRGHLTGSSTLTSHCLQGAHLEVTVTGSDVLLAGSDKEGNNMTLRGSLDNTGTLLKSTYILNGSATGGCELDDGTGTLTKR
jgi:hypothetical protein